jgi:peptide/nickel transport system ATP-binding protein
MTAPTLLEIDSLSLAIGATPILKNVSVQVAAGEILGLVGASGSGKSMTALAIMRLLPAMSELTGTIRFRGEALTDKDPRAMQKVRGRR